MDQTTCFNPPLVCQLLDGSRVRFARVTMRQWATMAEEMRAERVALLLAEIDKTDGLKPEEKLKARIAATDHTVSISTAIDRCLNEPNWITRLLENAAKAGGSVGDEATKSLDMIPAIQQASIAHQIAMLPVVKGAKAGTESNPLVPGVDLSGESTQDESADSSDSTPANSPIDNSTSTPG